MSKTVIGAYAHVDGGKTTLSEAILHKCGALSKTGRVDHEDSFLDYENYERRKGITVLMKQARFSYEGRDFIYVDTPGHLDFIGEVNRSFRILDAAILIIDATANIPADTIRRFSYLKTLNIPILLFLNKMDITHKTKEKLLDSVKKQLHPDIVPYDDCKEAVALNHEEILDEYLSSGKIEDNYIVSDLQQGLFFPLFYGSALREEGIEELLSFINRYVRNPETGKGFKAYIYKVDEYAHLKVFSGTLKNRDVFSEYKISEIVQFNGQKAIQVNEVEGEDLCAVKGLQGLKAGTYLPSLFCEDTMELNSLTYSIHSKLDDIQLYKTICPLNDEFPELHISLGRDVTIDLLGDLHKDFIQDLIKDRYSCYSPLSLK